MLDEDRESLNNFYPSDDVVSIYKGEIMRLNSDADFVWDLTKEEDDEKLFNTRLVLAEKKGLESGLKRGIEQGVEQGIEQNKLDVIKNMLAANSSIKSIAIALGVSEEEVSNLIKRNNLKSGE